MRFRFFLWDAADLGVRRSKVSSSFCNSGYIRVSRNLKPLVRPLECRARGPPGPCHTKLENVLQRELYEPRIARLTNFPIGRAVVATGGVATGIQKLGVIEGVEQLRAELHVRCFRDACVLVESQRPILDSGPTTNVARGVAQLAEGNGGGGERVGIEIKAAVLARVQVAKWKGLVGLAGEFKREGVAEQLAVRKRGDANREPSLIRSDTGHGPPIEDLSFGSAVLRERELPEVAQDETLA